MAQIGGRCTLMKIQTLFFRLHRPVRNWYGRENLSFIATITKGRTTRIIMVVQKVFVKPMSLVETIQSATIILSVQIEEESNPNYQLNQFLSSRIVSILKEDAYHRHQVNLHRAHSKVLLRRWLHRHY